MERPSRKRSRNASEKHLCGGHGLETTDPLASVAWDYAVGAAFLFTAGSMARSRPGPARREAGARGRRALAPPADLHEAGSRAGQPVRRRRERLREAGAGLVAAIAHRADGGPCGGTAVGRSADRRARRSGAGRGAAVSAGTLCTSAPDWIVRCVEAAGKIEHVGRRCAGASVCRPARSVYKAKAREANLAGFLTNNAGSDLLSHTVSHAVPSAVSGLTSVFGMGTGVTLIL